MFRDVELPVLPLRRSRRTSATPDEATSFRTVDGSNSERRVRGAARDCGGEDVSKRSRSRGPVSGRAMAASWIDYAAWSLFVLAVNAWRGKI